MAYSMLAEVTLTLGDYGVIGGMLLTFCVAISTLVFLMSKSQDRRIEVVEERLGTNVAEIHARVTEVDKGKVSHRDWVRVVMSQQSRQDRMSAQLAELIGKVDASMGIAGGVNRTAEATMKMADAIRENVETSKRRNVKTSKGAEARRCGADGR